MEYITGHISLRDIFLLYWDLYLSWYVGEIRKVVKENVEKLIKCRTSALGFHLYQCKKCFSVRLIPHSCKSRFCSTCGKINTDKWTSELLNEVLSVDYHHLVFTIPWQLRSICICNPKTMLNLLFVSASKSILDWTKQYGGYIPGIYIILHTFGSDLKYHPHLHVFITSGGLSLDKKRWINSPGDYLLPEKGLKKRWRYNVIKEIIKCNDKNLLKMPYLPRKLKHINLRGVISVISRLNWYVYIGLRLLEIETSIKYIGRYTKKPVIAETRIISISEKWVLFKFKDYSEKGKTCIKKMRLFTFITYLIQHIAEKHFRLVRGYGLFSNKLKGKLLPLTRKILNQKECIKSTLPDWRERNIKRTGNDPLVCNNCLLPMEFIFACFTPSYKWLYKLNLSVNDIIPNEQIKILQNSS